MDYKFLFLSLSAIFLVLFFLIACAVRKNSTLKKDQVIYDRVSKYITPRQTKIQKFITFFGSGIGIIGSITIFFFLLDNAQDRAFLILGMFGQTILNTLLKLSFRRLRPVVNPIVTEKGFSFPSGHAMASTALCGMILFFLWMSPLAIFIKIIITIFCIIAVPLIAASRVYLGVHYPSDVIAGIFCSISYLLFILVIYSKIRNPFL